MSPHHLLVDSILFVFSMVYPLSVHNDDNARTLAMECQDLQNISLRTILQAEELSVSVVDPLISCHQQLNRLEF